MMDLRQALQSSLGRQVAQLRERASRRGDPVDLRRQIERIRRRFGEGHKDLVTHDRVNAAVAKLRERGVHGLNSRERYVLAYGLAQETAALRGRALLADTALVSPLLASWRRDCDQGRLRSAVWRGLFRSYLQAPVGPAAEQLRVLLNGSLAGILRRAHERTPWLQVLRRHAGLLGKSPCSAYVSELLDGRREKLDELVRDLPPPPPSWFWEALVAALADQIVHLEDAQFRRRMEFILKLTEMPQLQLHRDQVLANVLDRYAGTRDRARDAGLLLFALEHWKSPQLKSSLKWNAVRPSTRQMVCGWLAQEDLEDFYRLCQDERQVDERRLAYWLRFKDQIGFSQIVLGSRLFWSREPDMRAFRERKSGRLAQLSGTVADNNAILMQIGEWLFVEFSARGNACYPYRIDEVPFETGSTVYSLGELKDVNAVTRSRAHKLIHNGSWEDAFDQALAEFRVRVNTGTDSSAHTVCRSPQLTGRRFSGSPDSGPWKHILPNALALALRRAGWKIEDLRDKGGSLWVYPGRAASDTLHRALTGAGFRLKPGRGYHRQ
jgi:hypothetical protein